MKPLTLNAIIRRLTCSTILVIGIPASAAHFDNRAATKNDDAQSVACMDYVRQLITVIDENTHAAVVRFQSHTKKTTVEYVGPPRRITVERRALTYIALDENDKFRIYVDGEFRLLKKLQGEPPPLGRVKGSVRVRWSLSSFGRSDQHYKRLKPLLFRGWKEQDGLKYPAIHLKGEPQPLHLVAVWPAKTKSVLEATFVGPVASADVDNLANARQWLAKHPWPTITTEKAEVLLDSSNPWMVNMGFVRLEGLKKLTPAHFGRAIKSLSVESAQRAMYDMFSCSMRNRTVREDLTKELSTFFANTSPRKQHRLLKTLNRYLSPSTAWIDLPRLQNAARKYRRQIENDPARREVLREIDALLKIRGKVIAS